MKLAVLIFTYRGDEHLTPICVNFVKETLGQDTRIVIADDGFNAMYQETRDRLIGMGCEYRQTDWPRFGNLLGPFHLEGATKLMAELAKDCDIIVKLDPDACIIRRDWVDRLWNDREALMTAAYKLKLNYPMGNSYAVKACCCEELAKDAKLYPGWVDCFEDYEIGVRVARIANGNPNHAIRYVCNLSGGFVLTTPWDIDYKKCLERCQVYCSGFSYGSMPPDKKIEYKNKQIEVHTILLNELIKAKQIMVPNIPAALQNPVVNACPTQYGNVLPQMTVSEGPAGAALQYTGNPSNLVSPIKNNPDTVEVPNLDAVTDNSGVSIAAGTNGLINVDGSVNIGTLPEKPTLELLHDSPPPNVGNIEAKINEGIDLKNSLSSTTYGILPEFQDALK